MPSNPLQVGGSFGQGSMDPTTRCVVEAWWVHGGSLVKLQKRSVAYQSAIIAFNMPCSCCGDTVQGAA
jgi:hypothetical protein